MKFESIKKNESGYMLLESLVTLIVVTTIIIIFFPLITDWLVLRNDEKNGVEQNRLLYETSMNWEQQSYSSTKIARDIKYKIESKNDHIKVSNKDKQVGVTIYEVNFE